MPTYRHRLPASSDTPLKRLAKSGGIQSLDSFISDTEADISDIQLVEQCTRRSHKLAL